MATKTNTKGKHKRGRAQESVIPKMVTHLEIAEQMSIKPQTLRKWAAAGMFPKPKTVIGTLWFYDAEAVNAFLEERGRAGQGA